MTVKPFELLQFEEDGVAGAEIKAQVLNTPTEEPKEATPKEDISPEPIEDDVTQMGLGMGFDGAGAVVSGVGGGGSLVGELANIVKAARVVKRVDPTYPEKARNAQLSGSVTLKVHISESGEVLHCLVLASEPQGVFDSSAISAVEKWGFEPAIKNGQKVASYLVQKVSFKMEN